jgi:hypothetical protein
MKPEIEKQIIKKANIFITVILLISLFPFYFIENKFLVLIGMSMLYFFISLLLLMHWYSRGLSLLIKFLDEPYYIKLYHLTGWGRSTLQKRIINILQSTKDPIAQKYEYCFYRIWLNYHIIYFRELFPSIIGNYNQVKIDKCDNLIDKMSKNLFRAKEKINDAKPDEHFKKLGFDPKSILNEDEFKIANQAYTPYSHLGIAGKLLETCNNNFYFLMQLQKYTFTYQDLKLLNRYINYISKKILKKKYNISDLDTISGVHRILGEVSIINNIQDSSTLEALLKFFSVFIEHELVPQKDLSFILKSIKTKMDYIDFQREIMEINLDYQKPKKKAFKI